MENRVRKYENENDGVQRTEKRHEDGSIEREMKRINSRMRSEFLTQDIKVELTVIFGGECDNPVIKTVEELEAFNKELVEVVRKYNPFAVNVSSFNRDHNPLMLLADAMKLEMKDADRFKKEGGNNAAE